MYKNKLGKTVEPITTSIDFVSNKMFHILNVKYRKRVLFLQKESYWSVKITEFFEADQGILKYRKIKCKSFIRISVILSTAESKTLCSWKSVKKIKETWGVSDSRGFGHFLAGTREKQLN